MKMEEKDFEPAGLIPRSIIRTVERFQQQLRPETIALGIQEFRISRYQVRVSVRYFFILLLLPISINWGAKNLIIKPLVGYFWNTHRTSLFLNNYQAGRAFQEMRDFESQLFFEMLLSIPESPSGGNNISLNKESSILALNPASLITTKENEKNTKNYNNILEKKIYPYPIQVQSFRNPDINLSNAESKNLTFESKNSNKKLVKKTITKPKYYTPLKIGFKEQNLLLTKQIPQPPVPIYTQEQFWNSNVDGTNNILASYDTQEIRTSEHFIIENTSINSPNFNVKKSFDRDWQLPYSRYSYQITFEKDQTGRPQKDDGLNFFFNKNDKKPNIYFLQPNLLSCSNWKNFNDYNFIYTQYYAQNYPCLAPDYPIVEQRKNNLIYPVNSLKNNCLTDFKFGSVQSLEYENWVNNYEQDSQIYDPDSNLQITKTSFAALFQKKALLLAEIYNQQSITALSNMFGDCVMIVSTILLIRWNAPQFTILKSFLIESFYSFNDAIKCFYIILITDFLVGFHSPRGWEIAMEMLLRHLGLPEDEEFILLFVGTFPVFLDTAFKYWIFRYLNKISPSTVATYHSMIE